MRILRTSLAFLPFVLAGACAPAASSVPASGALGAPTATTHDAPATGHFAAHFSVTAGELPEGLALAANTAYVGFAPTSRVVRVDLTTGVAASFGQLPAPVSGKGFMTGLARARSGDLYAGLASFVPEVQAGVYRIGKDGGSATLFSSDAMLPFPNALAFDDDGSLWVTDSGTGSLFHVDVAGHAQRWATGDLLTGKKHACGPGLGPEFAIGANGLVVEHDAIYVVNTDKAILVKIPRESAGNAGEPSIVVGPDCENLGGADGLARTPDGSFVVALNRQDKLVKLTPSGNVAVIAKGPPLDFPASLAFLDADLYVTNFALYRASAGQAAAPGLLKLSSSNR